MTLSKTSCARLECMWDIFLKSSELATVCWKKRRVQSLEKGNA
jgi:hypothetical protein